MIVATLVLQPLSWKFLYWLAKYRQFSRVGLSKCCLRNLPCLQMGYLSFQTVHSVLTWLALTCEVIFSSTLFLFYSSKHIAVNCLNQSPESCVCVGVIPVCVSLLVKKKNRTTSCPTCYYSQEFVICEQWCVLYSELKFSWYLGSDLCLLHKDSEGYPFDFWQICSTDFSSF